MKMKIKRLIKGEIHDGFNYYEKYYEVFINPTQHEINEIKKLNMGIRGVIDSNNDKYIWIAEILHASINGKIQHFQSVLESPDSPAAIQINQVIRQKIFELIQQFLWIILISKNLIQMGIGFEQPAVCFLHHGINQSPLHLGFQAPD